MPQTSSNYLFAGGRAFLVAGFVLLGFPAGNTVAEDLLGLYVGGAIGRAQVESSAPQYVSDEWEEFKENHSAYKLMVGIRPVSFLGAEVDYMDFGHPSGNLGPNPANVDMKGSSAFGVLYLPIPVVDVFLKAGLARLQSTVNALSPVQPLCVPCQPIYFQLDRTNTNFAAGAGAQYKFGSLAVRAEYERFTTAGEHPNLLSLGLTWTFF